MGFSHGSYVAYGVHVPAAEYATGHVWAEQDRIQEVLAANKDTLPDVGYLSAGPYDNDMLFLTADPDRDSDEPAEVELGEYRRLDASMSATRKDELDSQLAHAIRLLDYLPSSFDPPSWVVVPDMS